MNFIFDPSLVLYLPLYEPDGASLQSKDKYGHLCSVTGALWRPNGRVFDGDDKIVLPVASPLNFQALDEWTIEIWVYPTATAQAKAIAWGNTANNTPIISIRYIADRVDFEARNDDGSQSFTITHTVGINQWIHCVGIRRASNSWEFMVDGESRGTDSTEIGAFTINNLRVGVWDRTTFTHPWRGTIGEVRLYNRALTPLEIQQNYLATKWRYR